MHLIADGPCESVENFRGKLSAAATIHLLEGFIPGAGAAIRPVRRQCIETVADSNDPRTKWNLRAFEVAGVAAAIQAFVMVQKDEAHVFEFGNLLQGHPTELRMFFDQVELFIRQLSSLQQDVIGYADLTDIMEKSRENNDVHFRIAEPHSYRGTAAVLGHTVAVAAGI